MNEERIPIPKYGAAVLIGSFVIAMWMSIDSHHSLPMWINMLPIIAWFVGLVLGAKARTIMKVSFISKTIYFGSLFLSGALSLILLVDRTGDFSSPMVLPVQVLHSGRASGVAGLRGPDVTFEILYPDGRTQEASLGASGFGELHPGMTGKVWIGKGLFGIQYLKGVDFEEASK